jgi:hypothetical protein
MIFRSARLLVIAAIAALATAETRAQAEWGDLKIKFVYDGAAPKPAVFGPVAGGAIVIDESLLVDTDGGIANIVVYVRTRDIPVHPDYGPSAAETAIVVGKGARFDPHVLTMRLSQTLEFQNGDVGTLSVDFQPLGDVSLQEILPPGFAVTSKLTRAQSIPNPIRSGLQPWMSCYVLPRINPYAAVSNKDGTLTIKNLPTGDLEFQAWHERAGYVRTATWKNGKFALKIHEGLNDLGTIKLDPDLF